MLPLDSCKRTFGLGPWLALILLAAAPSLAQTLVDPTLSVDTVATGLSEPTTMAFVGFSDILVLEKASGEVRRVRNGVLENTPALTLLVNSDVERGLLGIAVNTENPPGVFLFYTEASPVDGSAVANRIVRYTWNAGTGLLEAPTSVRDFETGPGFHLGGVLALGSGATGEHLYAVIGDRDRFGKLQNQEPDDPDPDDTSVILRMQQDGSPAPGNPFNPYCSETTTTLCSSDANCPTGEVCIVEVASYYAYGVRNSFGLALDPVTGDLWDTENGDVGLDEVNRIVPGMNSGWRPLMGPEVLTPGVGPGDLYDIPGAGSTYQDPQFTWLPSAAPTGLVFPLNSTLGAAWDQTLLVATWQPFGIGAKIFALPLNATRDALDLSSIPGLADGVANTSNEANGAVFGEGFGRITDLERGPDGNIYVVSYDRGTIYRIRGPNAVPALPAAGLAVVAGVLAVLAALRLAAARRQSRLPLDC